MLLCGAHSFIHIGPKNVRARFFVYLLSVAVLMAMWIGFFADIATAAHAFNEATKALPAQP